MAGEHGLLTPAEAREHYRFQEVDSLYASELDQALVAQGIARIALPLTDRDFACVATEFDACMDYCPDVLATSHYKYDGRPNNDVGLVRKEFKLDKDGQQIEDAKSLIHFLPGAAKRWHEQFAQGPKVLREFINNTEEVYRLLTEAGRISMLELEETYPGITAAHYLPAAIGHQSLTVMRIISYDGYEVTENEGEVAKGHFDAGTATVHAYDDAPGLWIAKDGVAGERQYYDTSDGAGYFFLARGFDKIFQAQRVFAAWHGVSRLHPENVTSMPRRHAVVMFIDAPHVDYHLRSSDTTPTIADKLPTPRVITEPSEQVA